MKNLRYLIKPDKAEEIKEKFKNKGLANTSGLSICYINLILNGRRKIQKRIAYAFTKSINSELEIEDLFDKIVKD